MRHRPVPNVTACGTLRRCIPKLFATVLLVAAAVTALPSAAAAQAPSDVPNPPPFYAITNARIVTVSGPVIENGTVIGVVSYTDMVLKGLCADIPGGPPPSGGGR